MSLSVLVLLRREAKKRNRTVAELLQYLGMERFLYRLGCSCHRDNLILKGAMMMRVWTPEQFRPTRDIDFLVFGNNEIDNVKEIVKDMCCVAIPEDGFVFDHESIRCEPIKEADDYHGVHARFTGTIEGAKIPMRLDFGFGDVVVPTPCWSEYPSILNFPAPYLRMYSPESHIAEKLHAMVKLDFINSRMKDFFDIWFLSRHISFTYNNLSRAITKTFQARNTIIPKVIPSLQEPFIQEHNAMWKSFCLKSSLNNIPVSFSDVCYELSIFLYPIFKEEQEFKDMKLIWNFQDQCWKYMS